MSWQVDWEYDRPGGLLRRLPTRADHLTVIYRKPRRGGTDPAVVLMEGESRVTEAGLRWRLRRFDVAYLPLMVGDVKVVADVSLADSTPLRIEARSVARLSIDRLSDDTAQRKVSYKEARSAARRRFTVFIGIDQGEGDPVEGLEDRFRAALQNKLGRLEPSALLERRLKNLIQGDRSQLERLSALDPAEALVRAAGWYATKVDKLAHPVPEDVSLSDLVGVGLQDETFPEIIFTNPQMTFCEVEIFRLLANDEAVARVKGLSSQLVGTSALTDVSGQVLEVYRQRAELTGQFLSALPHLVSSGAVFQGVHNVEQLNAYVEQFTASLHTSAIGGGGPAEQAAAPPVAVIILVDPSGGYFEAKLNGSVDVKPEEVSRGIFRLRALGNGELRGYRLHGLHDYKEVAAELEGFSEWVAPDRYRAMEKAFEENRPFHDVVIGDPRRPRGGDGAN